MLLSRLYRQNENRDVNKSRRGHCNQCPLVFFLDIESHVKYTKEMSDCSAFIELILDAK